MYISLPQRIEMSSSRRYGAMAFLGSTHIRQDSYTKVAKTMDQRCDTRFVRIAQDIQ
jgi:hypothetical protein